MQVPGAQRPRVTRPDLHAWAAALAVRASRLAHMEHLLRLVQNSNYGRSIWISPSPPLPWRTP